MKALQEEKKALEERLEAHHHSNQEERDKATIIASERRARTQVSRHCYVLSHHINYGV